MPEIIETWPSQLPTCFIIGSFNMQTKPQVIRSEVDAGIAKVRRRFTTPIFLISGALTLTTIQLKQFYQWFNSMDYGGALSFTFNGDPVNGPGTYRFINPPVVSAINSNNYQISIELERMP